MAGFSYGMGGSFSLGGGCGVDISEGQNEAGYLDVTEVEIYTGAGEGIMAKVFAAYTWNLNFLKHSTDTSKE